MATELLLIAVGNTRTRYALVEDGEIQPAASLRNDRLEDDAAELRAVVEAHQNLAVLIASVNKPVAKRVQEHVDEAAPAGTRVLRFGQDVAIDVPHSLTPPITVGQDRLLAALGAFARSDQACVVVDAGTAITADFIDGQGIFHGGAIAPGVRMMLASLHEHTAALPEVEFSPDLAPSLSGGWGLESDDDGAAKAAAQPFGKTTAQAMVLGAVSAARGLVHTLVDRYAEFYEAYPRVVATGGDAPMLFENDPIVEHIVPDLVLIGMLTAWQMHVANEEDADQELA